ncbi:MAG: homocysteine S-methyltransferase family protein [Clostridia bacterium]|nr:homocysteine S-methyltransferase family protein [Clostridia bacterium]
MIFKDQYMFFDGGTGTVLQSMGLKPGEQPEAWNLSAPEKIIALHKAYIEAGANLIKTNTFGASPLKFGENFAEVVKAGVQNAKEAVKGTDTLVALDIGPTGKLLKPYGDLEFEDAVACFAEVVKAGKNADLILIETMNDSLETKAAVLAAKENSDLPIFVTCVYDETGKLMTGATPEAMVAMLEGLGVSAIGVNCSLGPVEMQGVVQKLVENASVPVIVNPNAGLPKLQNGETVFDITPIGFADAMETIANMGACILGGCCGTTPDHIRAMTERVKKMPFKAPVPKQKTVVSSYTHAVEIGQKPILIGERINPTGKPRLKEALREHKMDYILNEGLQQQEKKVHILDVNVGLPEIDEPSMMEETVKALQAVSDLPLQIDTSDFDALEKGMRCYNGKPMVNSVNGKQESMDKVFPLVKKYGGVVVALTLDETGIPKTVEGRLAIADKIYAEASKYGISPKDIVVDALAMTISSDTASALTTLETVRRLSALGRKTSLGVSNISFGLPNREAINSTFFGLAMENGLSAAIMNPHSEGMMQAYYSFCALHNLDANCTDYITYNADKTAPQATAKDTSETLKSAIIKGLKDSAGALCKSLLAEEMSAMDIIKEHIIPALDVAGKGFEQKTVFLPQLLMSAEAAKEAFEVVKSTMTKTASDKGKVIVATVEGDIHDIGKNIVKVLLENYGFDVLDLGKDVKAETVLEETKKHNVKLVGLSALMTTTVPAMEKTIKLLREQAPDVKVVVGGAVLTQEYADAMGADKYAKDAMETVRYAEELFSAV